MENPMSELTNAVALARDNEFRDWVRAATCYQARQTIAAGDTGASRQMAVETISNPTVHLDRWVHVLSTDPAITTVGAIVGDGEGEIGETLLISQVAATWLALATVLYPQG